MWIGIFYSLSFISCDLSTRHQKHRRKQGHTRDRNTLNLCFVGRTPICPACLGIATKGVPALKKHFSNIVCHYEETNFMISDISYPITSSSTLDSGSKGPDSLSSSFQELQPMRSNALPQVASYLCSEVFSNVWSHFTVSMLKCLKYRGLQRTLKTVSVILISWGQDITTSQTQHIFYIILNVTKLGKANL